MCARVCALTPATYSGKSNGKEYTVDLALFGEVDPDDEASKWSVGKRSCMFYVIKKEKEGDSWPRLLEDKKLEKTNITVDWDKFVDSDEEAEAFDTGGMDTMGGGGGPPGESLS